MTVPSHLSSAAESPVTLEVIKGALRAAQAEMSAVLDRTAMSPFIREKKDYFIGFFDEVGGLIHGAGLPLMGNIIKPVLDRFPIETMRPGDIYWYNDCYGSKGAVSHTPDQVIIAPVIVDGRVRAFSQSWAHFNDIGGLRPGTLSPDADNIFQEGTIVPPIKLLDRGTQNDDAVAIFVANSRYPDMVRGDLRALIAAVRLGARRLGELFDRYNDATILWALDQSKRQSAELTRTRIAELLKPGKYSFVDRVDSDGHGNGPFDVAFDLTVDGNGGLSLDASRSSDQAPGPINFLMPPTVPGMSLGLYATRNDPTLLVNEGMINTIEEITLRSGSVLQPNYPAPLGLRGTTFVKVQQAVLGLVNAATDGQGPAASNAYSLYYMRGKGPDGSPFLLTDGVAVGYGARPTADGIDAVYFIAQENYPVEFVEMGFPIRILTYSLNIDSGGPGRWRGGTGVIREIEVMADQTLCSVRIEGTINPPWGVSDGRAGRPGRIFVNYGKADQRSLPPVKDGIVLNRGDILRMETGGGGGWGNPFDRPAEVVLDDVLNGMVSMPAARDDYGVVIDEALLSIDVVATEALRATRAERVLFHYGRQ
ncbi:hydantoinase B/oxoprolinase family protein [Corticibacterium sp. UT-5YL-CI-8]|nr:hydantoinase B/oxoprolinase family protein [Tianweitania sp. UT-5YL-CI-8]